jgi:hypothetical protein
VLWGRKETVLGEGWGMSDRRNVIEKCYGMEINVKKLK